MVMLDLKLYYRVRRLLESGNSEAQVYKILQDEFSEINIDEAIQEYKKEEATDYDDKLVKYIETRLRAGDITAHISDELIKKGHKQFEVEKAMIRAKTVAQSHLYVKVRKLLESGFTADQVLEKLSFESSKDDLLDLVNEYYKDEKSDYDNKLILHIENRFKEGQFLPAIFDELVKSGHKPFEIEKAMLRARTSTNSSMFDVIKKWQTYSQIQFSVFALTIVLGILYHAIFFIATIFLILQMIAAYIKRKLHPGNWDLEILLLESQGKGVRQNKSVFNYNPLYGNYWNVWIFDPAVLALLFFVCFGLYCDLAYGYSIFYICLALGLLSSISFFFRKFLS
jgi:hypothetical protein